MTNLEQYRAIFLADAREALSQIRAAVGKLRSNAIDKDALFDVLRLFHSLKSSSAMMGHTAVSAQAAAQEKVFMGLQGGGGTLTQELLDVAEKDATSIAKELGIQ